MQGNCNGDYLYSIQGGHYMSKIIRNDVLNWLLEDENPEVKYRTMIELLDMPKHK